MLWTRSARLLILTVFLGTGLLAMVEDLNVFDAFYLVGMGVSTVGCGDVVPQTPQGRICVIIIIQTINYTYLGTMYLILRSTYCANVAYSSRNGSKASPFSSMPGSNTVTSSAFCAISRVLRTNAACIGSFANQFSGGVFVSLFKQ